jgi:hypothetical protein
VTSKWYRDAGGEFWRMSKQHGGLQPEVPGGGFGKVQMLVFAQDQYGLTECNTDESVVLEAFDKFRPRSEDEFKAWFESRHDVLALFEIVAEHARTAAAITAGRKDLDQETVTEILTVVDKQQRATVASEGIE